MKLTIAEFKPVQPMNTDAFTANSSITLLMWKKQVIRHVSLTY